MFTFPITFISSEEGDSNGLLNNLRAYYKSDTSGSYPDSENNYDLIISGATFDSGGGIINSCYEYDGSNDRIEANTDLGISDTPVSVSGWLKFDGSNSSFRCMWQLGDRLTDGKYFRLIFQDRKPQLNSRSGTGGGTTTSITSTTTLNTGQWYHLVCVIASDSDLKLYIDGVDQSLTVTNPGNKPNVINRFSLGRAGDSTPGLYLDGRIDEVGVWDRALTADDVTTLYNSGSAFSYDNFD